MEIMTQTARIVKELVHICKVLENLSLAIGGQFRYNDSVKRLGNRLSDKNALHLP
jgi:hypothetical protein